MALAELTRYVPPAGGVGGGGRRALVCKDRLKLWQHKMTKAALFSVGIAFILLLVLLDRRKLVRRNDAPSRQLRAAYAALVLAFLATLAPWLVHNSINLGRPQMIAGRGEGILGMRMIFDRLPPLGLFYASSPPPLMEKLGP